ncbi:MAG: hypothetical protein JWM31_1, partial [Solirubrobacterales bacterium]|nr:hypothetical protein [Solirubrobacterales bacterium]
MNPHRAAVLLAMTVSLAATAAATAAATTASAVRPDPKCLVRPGQLAVTRGGDDRVWHRGDSLYACTTAYAHAPKAKRMGPWAPGTKVSFDGSNLAWTVPMVIAGRRTDRVWAANVDAGRRWMLAQKPNPGGADKPAREGRVQRLQVRDRALAWVTAGGDVVGALV